MPSGVVLGIHFALFELLHCLGAGFSLLIIEAVDPVYKGIKNMVKDKIKTS